MIEDTVFTNETIIETIKNIYGIDVTDVQKLNRGSANIFVLNNEQYILKEFQSKYTRDEIEKEIKIINHLKNDNIPVPSYILTLDNEYSFIYKGKVIILQEFIKGYTIESNTGNYDQMLESAAYYGKILNSLETLDIALPANNILNLYNKQKIDENIMNYEKMLDTVNGEYKERIVHDLKDKISMLEFIKNNVDLSEMENLTIKNTHGDYSVLQFIYENGKIKSIIDFASACKMPIVWEIIRSYSYIDEDAKDGIINVNHLIDYVKEFSKYFKLNKYDIKYMPYLYLIQLLSSTYGYKQYIADNSKMSLLEFAFFRTHLCKYLFDNVSSISKELETAFNINE